MAKAVLTKDLTGINSGAWSDAVTAAPAIVERGREEEEATLPGELLPAVPFTMVLVLAHLLLLPSASLDSGSWEEGLLDEEEDEDTTAVVVAAPAPTGEETDEALNPTIWTGWLVYVLM